MLGIPGQDPDGPTLGQEFHHHGPADETAAAGDQSEAVFGFRFSVFGGGSSHFLVLSNNRIYAVLIIIIFQKAIFCQKAICR